jgi:FkbM family methyltransferase
MKVIKNGNFTFHCDSSIEEWRAETMFTKEPGTIAWLQNNIRPGDVFWDVGANIGVYSLFAASRGAEVYAFEPHVGSAAALLRNISVNRLTDKIHLVCLALDSRAGMVPFYYSSKTAGASGNQLHMPVGEDGKTFSANAVELKLTAAGDELKLPAPQLVKIDTDGNEYAVLGGMRQRLCQVRTVQVETRKADVTLHLHEELLANCGLHLDHRHYTSTGQKKVNSGAEPLSVVHNAVYCRPI